MFDCLLVITFCLWVCCGLLCWLVWVLVVCSFCQVVLVSWSLLICVWLFCVLVVVLLVSCVCSGVVYLCVCLIFTLILGWVSCVVFVDLLLTRLLYAFGRAYVLLLGFIFGLMPGLLCWFWFCVYLCWLLLRCCGFPACLFWRFDDIVVVLVLICLFTWFVCFGCVFTFELATLIIFWWFCVWIGLILMMFWVCYVIVIFSLVVWILVCGCLLWFVFGVGFVYNWLSDSGCFWVWSLVFSLLWGSVVWYLLGLWLLWVILRVFG